MKIYRYTTAEGYCNFLVDKEYWEIKNSIGRGNSLAKDWKPFPIRTYKHVKKKGDFPLVFGNPVVSENAWKKLKSFIGESVEALKLTSDHGIYYALNVLDIIDALDRDKSEISYNSVTNRVSSIQKYVLDGNKLVGKHFFKIPETKGLETLFSEEFRQLVESLGLKGLDFSEKYYSKFICI